ncbi:MAG: KaiC domain-containing protein [Candidatus Thermoplasmatota archaeon]|nr:KaiC domain-containing protein [Candidatus Thermoplasmatota archaeon]
MMNERVETGIPGLDEMLGGGFPRNHTVVVMGSFGTGKTTFALQFLWRGLENGEKAIFISLEEDEKAVVGTAKDYGWDMAKHVESGALSVVKLEPADAKSTITRIKSELPDFIKETGASRVVLDSVSLLTMMFDRVSEQRDTLFHIAKLIKESGATAIFTAEVKDSNPSSSRDGLAEYTADGVILLRYNEMGSDVSTVLRIVKMRRTEHIKRVKPYSVSSNGITVHVDAESF